MSLPQVPVRKLGSLGLLASAQGLGCMSMSNSYLTNYTHTDEDSIATIHRALELGVTFLGRSLFPVRSGHPACHMTRGASNTCRTVCQLLLLAQAICFAGTVDPAAHCACIASSKERPNLLPLPEWPSGLLSDVWPTQHSTRFEPLLPACCSADTSDAYGPFHNEELVGRAIKGVSHSMSTVAHVCTPASAVHNQAGVPVKWRGDGTAMRTRAKFICLDGGQRRCAGSLTP
jgi:hypothetical protein